MDGRRFEVLRQVQPKPLHRKMFDGAAAPSWMEEK